MWERKLAANGFVETDKLTEAEKAEARAKFAQKEVVWYNSVIVPVVKPSLKGRLTAIARLATNPAARVVNLVSELWGAQSNVNWGLAAKFAACFKTDQALIAFLLGRINDDLPDNVISALYPLANTIGGRVEENKRTETIRTLSRREQESLQQFQKVLNDD